MGICGFVTVFGENFEKIHCFVVAMTGQLLLFSISGL